MVLSSQFIICLFCYFKVWMCGGKVLIATCSRVGHVFRKVSPYTWPGGVVNILNHNTMRTVEVWMDDHKDFFYKLNPSQYSPLLLFFGSNKPFCADVPLITIQTNRQTNKSFWSCIQGCDATSVFFLTELIQSFVTRFFPIYFQFLFLFNSVCLKSQELYV